MHDKIEELTSEIRFVWLLLRVEDAHDVTKALGVFRDLEL